MDRVMALPGLSWPVTTHLLNTVRVSPFPAAEQMQEMRTRRSTEIARGLQCRNSA